MVTRLFLGLFIGAIVGALVAAGAMALLGSAVVPMGPFFAFVLAAATGALTGLVAGKPIWARGGGIEAGLKAFFGALLAAGGMYAIRTWLHYNVDLSIAHAGVGAIGELPGAALPLIAAVLGGFYGLDNTPEAKDDKKGGPRVAGNVRVATSDHEEEEDAAPSAAAKKRSR